MIVVAAEMPGPRRCSVILHFTFHISGYHILHGVLSGVAERVKLHSQMTAS